MFISTKIVDKKFVILKLSYKPSDNDPPTAVGGSLSAEVFVQHPHDIRWIGYGVFYSRRGYCTSFASFYNVYHVFCIAFG